MTTAENTTVKNATTAVEKLDPKVRTLADKLKAVTTYAGDGRFTTESDFYANNLTGNLTKELYEEDAAHKTIFMAATTLAHGELSNEQMAKDPDLKSTRLDVPVIAKDYFASKHTKSQTIGTATHHGITQMTYEVYGSKTHGQNQMQVVKDIISSGTKDILANL